MYQLLVNGNKIGQYSIKASPAKTAEKIARQIFQENDMTGSRTFDFEFVKNRTKAEGGDKLYRFRARVKPLPKTKANLIHVGDASFYKKFDVEVKNLDRID